MSRTVAVEGRWLVVLVETTAATCTARGRLLAEDREGRELGLTRNAEMGEAEDSSSIATGRSRRSRGILLLVVGVGCCCVLSLPMLLLMTTIDTLLLLCVTSSVQNQRVGAVQDKLRPRFLCRKRVGKSWGQCLHTLYREGKGALKRGGRRR